MDDLRLDLVLIHTRPDEFEQSTKGFFRDVAGMLHHFHFQFGLDGTQIFHDPGRTLILMKGIAHPHFLSVAIVAYRNEVGLAVVLICIEIDRLRQMYPGLQQSVETVEPYDRLDTGEGGGFLLAVPASVPFFFQFVGPDEHQHLAVFRIRIVREQHEHGILLDDAGQPV